MVPTFAVNILVSAWPVQIVTRLRKVYRYTMEVRLHGKVNVR